MTTYKICPHCGYDLDANADIERDGFMLSYTNEARYNGEVMQLTRQQNQLLYTVAKADRPIAAAVIGDRISDAVDSYRLVQVVLTQLRAIFRADGIPMPIVNVRGHGLAWRLP
jgi:DNA-binding response OmpR family regulator